MNRNLACLVILLCSTSIGSAGVISRDWKTPGDGLLTYDDVNRREWLDLTDSLIINLGEGVIGESFSFDYQRDVISELAPGGMFEGFLPATTAGVVALAQSAGMDTNTTDFAVNGVAAGALIDLLGPTFSQGAPIGTGVGRAFIFGLSSDLVIDLSGETSNQIVSLQYSFFPPNNNSTGASLQVGFTSDFIRSNTLGMWLYRQPLAVPEPSAAALGLVFSS